MKQYTVVVNDIDIYQQAIATVREVIDANPGSKALIQVVEPTGNPDNFRDKLEELHRRLPDATIYGMTSQGSAMDNPRKRKAPVGSFMLFEKSDYYAQVYDCTNMSTYDAGVQFVKGLEDKEDIKGIILMSADMRLVFEDFVDCILEKYPDVPIFGAMAGSEDLAKDFSLIFLNDQIYKRGILAIALYGKDLHIETKHNLGWRPLGREFTITKSTPDGLVHEIDGRPAVDIYREYLGIEADQYFFQNTAAFPFLFKQNNKLVGRVAINYSGEAIRFTMPIPEGTRASLAYARKKYLLGECLENANKLIDFAPQGMLIYSCVTRRNFMGDSLSEKEYEYYRNVCPDVSCAGGYGELLYSKEGAGLLNGTLIAVGFREGDKPDNIDIKPMVEEQLGYKNEPLPLIERMVNLLEKTTDDLRENVKQLYHYASHDTLTGLYNRSAFDYEYEKALSEMGEIESLSLLMIDIDFFKKVNDNHGHDVGDEVIRKVVKTVRIQLPKNTAFCRWGGEEFVCIIKNLDKDDAVELAEKIRSAVEESDFEGLPKVTVSVGVTTATSDSEKNKHELFASLDKALYEAKETGRNKVVYKE